jgi:hypothetical protein
MGAEVQHHRALLQALTLAAAYFVTTVSGGVAMADDGPASTQESITGREEERRLEGDGTREVGNAFAFVPRKTLEYFFLAHAIVARFAYDHHLVPEAKPFGPRQPKIFVFPTLFVETNRTWSIGTHMVAQGGPFATSHRVGFGSVHDLVAESRVQYAPAIGPVQWVTSVEGLAESQSELEYSGVGQSPRSDARNRFVGTTPFDAGLYRELRMRGIVESGVRPHRFVQLQQSVSLTRRQLQDARDAGDEALSRVFEPGSVRLWGPDTWIAYGETACRFDTRDASGRPTPGVMAEAYGGYARETRGLEAAFARVGGRLAGFIPIYRTTNILSPRLVLDGVVDVDGLPFTELARQPDYRGLDDRRDFVSLVGSLDYIWAFARFAALRVFVDAATVGPAVEKLPLDRLRVAGGGGIDIFSAHTNIMSMRLGGSADGFHLALGIGRPLRFGDRQHRD